MELPINLESWLLSPDVLLHGDVLLPSEIFVVIFKLASPYSGTCPRVCRRWYAASEPLRQRAMPIEKLKAFCTLVAERNVLRLGYHAWPGAWATTKPCAHHDDVDVATPLEIAAGRGYIEIVDKLLRCRWPQDYGNKDRLVLIRRKTIWGRSTYQKTKPLNPITTPWMVTLRSCVEFAMKHGEMRPALWMIRRHGLPLKDDQLLLAVNLGARDVFMAQYHLNGFYPTTRGFGNVITASGGIIFNNGRLPLLWMTIWKMRDSLPRAWAYNAGCSWMCPPRAVMVDPSDLACEVAHAQEVLSRVEKHGSFNYDDRTQWMQVGPASFKRLFLCQRCQVDLPSPPSTFGTRSYLRCSLCRLHYYCSRFCQEDHWFQHFCTCDGRERLLHKRSAYS